MWENFSVLPKTRGRWSNSKGTQEHEVRPACLFQAFCGSCWSFSTTGCLEGAWFLAGYPLESLSEQQLVACDTEYNQGCNGGWPSLAMDYISNNGGIVPEIVYPYKKVGGISCWWLWWWRWWRWCFALAKTCCCSRSAGIYPPVYR